MILCAMAITDRKREMGSLAAGVIMTQYPFLTLPVLSINQSPSIYCSSTEVMVYVGLRRSAGRALASIWEKESNPLRPSFIHFTSKKWEWGPCLPLLRLLIQRMKKRNRADPSLPFNLKINHVNQCEGEKEREEDPIWRKKLLREMR